MWIVAAIVIVGLLARFLWILSSDRTALSSSSLSAITYSSPGEEASTQTSIPGASQPSEQNSFAETTSESRGMRLRRQGTIAAAFGAVGYASVIAITYVYAQSAAEHPFGRLREIEETFAILGVAGWGCVFVGIGGAIAFLVSFLLVAEEQRTKRA